jgi:hypothetical protein
MTQGSRRPGFRSRSRSSRIEGSRRSQADRSGSAPPRRTCTRRVGGARRRHLRCLRVRWHRLPHPSPTLDPRPNRSPGPTRNPSSHRRRNRSRTKIRIRRAPSSPSSPQIQNPSPSPCPCPGPCQERRARCPRVARRRRPRRLRSPLTTPGATEQACRVSTLSPAPVRAAAHGSKKLPMTTWDGSGKRAQSLSSSRFRCQRKLPGFAGPQTVRA